MINLQSADTALDRLYREAMADLDQEGGGIRWMQGQLDWQRACLIGEYFLSAITGVRGALHAAAFSARRYREKEYSDNKWLAGQWQKVRSESGASREDYLKAMTRGPTETDRELEIHISADHCFFHLAQALDRVAVYIAVVAALRLELLGLDWQQLTQVAAGFTEKGHTARQQPPAGKSEQDAVLALVRDEPSKHGPPDWLPWLLQARNTATHRAPRTEFAVLREERGAARGACPTVRSAARLGSDRGPSR